MVGRAEQRGPETQWSRPTENLQEVKGWKEGRAEEDRSAPLSAEQSQAADRLFAIRGEYKKIDKELASQATAMLREMVEKGDVDVARVSALVKEAERRYSQVQVEVPKHKNEEDDDIKFVRQEIRRVEAPKPVERPKDVWEDWRAHLRASGSISEDGMTANRRPEELGLTKEQLDEVMRRQQVEYMSASRDAGVGPRLVASQERAGVPSLERQRLEQRRQMLLSTVDAMKKNPKPDEAAKARLVALEAQLTRVEDELKAA